jgi:hypothetical protein
MRMNGDQNERARKMVAVLSSWVAPARPGALCAALELAVYEKTSVSATDVIMMSQIYTTHYCTIDDRLSFLSTMPDLLAWIDLTIEELCTTLLMIENTEGLHVSLKIQETGISEVTHAGEIIIIPRQDAHCRARDWFELLFRHEYTHWLTQRYWGNAPTILWEGLPLYLGDNMVRQRILQFSYHEYCRALCVTENLLALSTIVAPHAYYGKRHDVRIDLESGSFTGYLIEQYGIFDLKQVFQAYIPPTPVVPILKLNPLFTAIYGKTFEQLEAAWQSFLRETIAPNTIAEAHVGTRAFSSDIQIRRIHCKFCLTPINMEICPVCQAQQNIEIVVI